ncbi:MAG: DUF5723 family protein [Nitritalea sp.]
MKHFRTLLSLAALALVGPLQAQQFYPGPATGVRRGFSSILMNPAEITSLHRTVELNLVQMNVGAGGNIEDFVLNIDNFGNGLEESLTSRVDPLDFRINGHILGPSIAVRAGKIGVGLSSQIHFGGDFANINPNLGTALAQFDSPDFTSTRIQGGPPQRANFFSYAQLSAHVGGALIEDENSRLSIGASIHFYAPVAFAEAEVRNLNATLFEENGDLLMRDASGSVRLAYSRGADLDGSENFDVQGRVSLGLDIGATYLLKNTAVGHVQVGAALRNMGALLFDDALESSYALNVPAGEALNLSALSGTFEEIESQLLASGFVSLRDQRSELRIPLPTTLALYGDFQPLPFLQVGAYFQKRLQANNPAGQIVGQDLFVLTPSLFFGPFEVYFPTGVYEVYGFAAGAGLRLGGFFIGTSSGLSSALGRQNHADIHFGLNLGIGKKLNILN